MSARFFLSPKLYGNKIKNVHKKLYFVLLVTGWLGIVLASVWPSLPFFVGYLRLQSADLSDTQLNIPQAVQAHFLKYDFYIPQENIFTAADTDHPEIFKICPKGEVLIWTTLHFKIPFWRAFAHQACFKIG